MFSSTARELRISFSHGKKSIHSFSESIEIILIDELNNILDKALKNYRQKYLRRFEFLLNVDQLVQFLKSNEIYESYGEDTFTLVEASNTIMRLLQIIDIHFSKEYDHTETSQYFLYLKHILKEYLDPRNSGLEDELLSCLKRIRTLETNIYSHADILRRSLNPKLLIFASLLIKNYFGQAANCILDRARHGFEIDKTFDLFKGLMKLNESFDCKIDTKLQTNLKQKQDSLAQFQELLYADLETNTLNLGQFVIVLSEVLNDAEKDLKDGLEPTILAQIKTYNSSGQIGNVVWTLLQKTCVYGLADFAKYLLCNEGVDPNSAFQTPDDCFVHKAEKSLKKVKKGNTKNSLCTICSSPILITSLKGDSKILKFFVNLKVIFDNS